MDANRASRQRPEPIRGALQRVVVVGRGVAGLEFVTQLGDHVVRALAHRIDPTVKLHQMAFQMRNFGLSRETETLVGTPRKSSKRASLFLPPIDAPSAERRLAFLLSIVAGSADVIGFLALGGLFTAHITGNIVVLAARFVAGGQADLSHLLAVPVFMLVLGLTRLLAAWLEHARIPSLAPLLLLELALLTGFLAVGLGSGHPNDPNAVSMVFAGMLGVAAMAVQNALVRISLTGAPSTAVMTTNVTVFAMDIGEILLAPDANRVARARERARNTGVAIAGFVVGCAFGAAEEHFFGLHALAIPISFASIAFALGFAATPRRRICMREENSL